MKILFLTDQVYLYGGIEKVLSQKANYFAEILGDEVTIITYNQQNKKPSYSFSSKITFMDLGVNYEIGRSYFHPKNLKKVPRHIYGLKKVIHHLKPDVVISSSFGPDFYFLPFVASRIPKIKEFHSTRFFSSKSISFKSLMMKKMTDYMESKFAQLVILNEDEVKYFKSDNVTIIPNPAEIGVEKCNLEKKKIIAAGRISYQKNFEDLIEIGKKIFEEFRDWEIHIYGDDYLGRKDILQKVINDSDLQYNIFFKGTTPDLKKTFLEYSIYAMTSNHETFPMVLLEALSVGLPIVSYDCPTGPSRIITNAEDSFLVPYKNLDIFTEKLKLLMQNENLRQEMGIKAIENVQRFSIDKVMQQWKNLLNGLVT